MDINSPQPDTTEDQMLEQDLHLRLKQSDDAIRFHEQKLFEARTVANACQAALTTIAEHRESRNLEAKVEPQSALHMRY